ncbi:cyclic AMP-responsive element-binding protein 5 isoform X4 [Betta splendens]|uniref:Cyclic AMP-responsive element-binding protein 5 isoform X4 n=1 Tax=Betta splendens TaxID=158456 RepID=A0A9W2XBW8_BETSP|nr:cyclic AMP-responsive element-binding protein 5 isoform X4 [Betta splendens]
MNCFLHNMVLFTKSGAPLQVNTGVEAVHVSCSGFFLPESEKLPVPSAALCQLLIGSRSCTVQPVPGSLSSLLHLRNRQRQPLPASMPGTLPDPTMPGSSAVLMPMERQMSMGSNMMGMQGPTHNSSCSSTHIPSMHSEAKLRLKAALSHHPGAIANGNMNSMGHMMEMMSSRPDQGAHHHMHSHPHHLQAPPHAYQHHSHHHHPQGHGQGGHHHPQGHNPHHNSHNPHLHPGHPHQTSPHPPMHSASQMSPATQQMQPTQTLQSPPPSGGRRRRVVDEDPDERRRKFLERNRAAATRCRQKRKVWVMSLEKKAEELTQTNMQLQNEVTMLKNEVTQLKQLLLTHKDCPITTMQKESQGYLSPESSPAGSPAPACSQQQVIQHNTITTSTTPVGGGGVHGQANHHTDINPIH